MTDTARKLMRRLDALGRISDEPGLLVRTFASPAMKRANALVAEWMREAGMKTRTDAVGNLIGFYPGEKPDAKILLMGSHLDTVRDAGKFDGPLGVLLSIACVEKLKRHNVRLPFAIQVVGFADEEGVRYHTTYLGSRALAGTFEKRDLDRKDEDGIAMRDAIKKFGGDAARINRDSINAKNYIGYLEPHIEQGPVLEKKNLSIAVVTGIAGQTRARVIFTGKAGHAGTTPMDLRRDALCGAAEFILAVQALGKKTPGLVTTVGQIKALPGASNVIPAEVSLSLDVRHSKDSVRSAASKVLKATTTAIAKGRNLRCVFETTQETAAVQCSADLSGLLAQSVRTSQKKVVSLPSGAGHDAAIMAKIMPSAMLFIRCKDGLSHHPDESVNTRDVAIAFDVLNDFISRLARKLQIPRNRGAAKRRGDA